MNTTETAAVPTSRLGHLLSVKNRLPPQLKTLFELLFEDGMTEEQACQRLRVDRATLDQDRSTMMRSLKRAASN